MRPALPTITPPCPPAKKDGTPDRRYGAHKAGAPRNAAAFPLADYAVAQQHVADLEAAGLVCSLEPNHLDRPEVWSIVDRQSGNRFLIWRAGSGTVVDSYLPRLDAIRSRHGMEAEAGQPLRRRCKSVDAAWNVVREWGNVPRAAYAFEAGQAVEVVARLPAWLTAS